MIITAIVIGSLLTIVIGFMAYNRIIPIGLGIHKPVYQKDNIALEGYDITTYFTGKLLMGSSDYAMDYKDVTWYFKSIENKNEFSNNPEKYMPQFGGYCSKAVSTGFAAPASPTIYTVYNDKLYVFSSEDVKAEFLKDPNSIIAQCSKKWK